jgi:hypothetical protein
VPEFQTVLNVIIFVGLVLAVWGWDEIKRTNKGFIFAFGFMLLIGGGLVSCMHQSGGRGGVGHYRR